ncbi:hypothetical protein CARUB_v10002587mg [Capsella rubella]|uniref:Morc S5 domain-containing protein n=1 Tax=Capsella rubella TaxID=81985 RepID=R0FCP1_9BRAS|nr:hypothetical protein CARUB_v10002587mg [Capsella rubella]
MTDSGSTNPKSQSGATDSTLGDGSSHPGLKRDLRNYDKDDDDDTNSLSTKKPRITTIESTSESCKKIVPLDVTPLTIVPPETPKLSRQFWKAGDDDESVPLPRYCSNDAAVRVHPQFLHANATSHKWALGALAELLDNSLDEVNNGATYVHVNSATNERDEKSNILIVEDNGGGMNPSTFRECLSLGYSRKRNMADRVGQYGNGFKTSTMRLGADAIVFSRCRGTNGNNPTQSIGMLSYTFLYETRKCEAIVPTVDYELVDNEWKEIVYNSRDGWSDNLETIVKWSPYLSEQDLLDQFDHLEEQGTRIVIYNLWEDDEGKLELDFDTDPHDIQLRGVNRDEKNIEMAKAYPNSRHFLTYRHSLRSYASILYLKRPPNFRIILRGKDVEHHSILDDMMMKEEKTYKPVRSPEWSSDQDEMCATIKLGFVKDAHHHIDIQGFNVYHKNRLIKPFWRVWNAAGSDGRGVIGILEANFIQPAHNKQGFERTAVLSKLEGRLVHHQKHYWSSRCHEIGYAPRRKQKNYESNVTVPARPIYTTNLDRGSSSTAVLARSRQNSESFVRNQIPQVNTQASVKNIQPESRSTDRNRVGISLEETSSVNVQAELQKGKQESAEVVSKLQREKTLLELQLKESKAKIQALEKAQREKELLLESQLKESKVKIQNLENRQEGVNKIFHEERARRDVTENALRKKLREASDVIDGLKKQVETFKGKRML